MKFENLFVGYNEEEDCRILMLADCAEDAKMLAEEYAESEEISADFEITEAEDIGNTEFDYSYVDSCLYIGYNKEEDYRILIFAYCDEDAQMLADEYAEDLELEGSFEVTEAEDFGNLHFDCDYVVYC